LDKDDKEFKHSVEFGAKVEINNKNSLKLKVDTEHNVAASWRHDCSKRVSSTFGTWFKAGGENHYYNKSSIIPVPVGFQLEFNF